METFKLEVYAYPINNNDGYFTVKVTAPKLPYEHYKRNNGAYGCRRASALLILLMTVHPYTSTPHILDMYLNEIIY